MTVRAAIAILSVVVAARAVAASPAPPAPAGKEPPAAGSAPDARFSEVSGPGTGRDLDWPGALRALAVSNRAIAGARRALAIARAEVTRVDVRPNPALSASIGNTIAGRFGYGTSDRTIGIEQQFERGGKRDARRRVAQAQVREAEANLADVARRERIGLAAAFDDLLGAQELAALSVRNVADYDRLVAAAQRRVAAGDLAPIELSRLRVERARAANDARTAQLAIDAARAAIAESIGEEGRAGALRALGELPGREVIAATTDLAPDADRLAALAEERADVRAARSRIEAGEAALEGARALRSRDLTLGLSAERSPASGGTIFTLSASVPLFLNNDYGGDIARADAELQAARVERDRVAARIGLELARAAAVLHAARDRALRLIDEALPQVEQVAKSLEYGFERGGTSLTDLFDARRQLVAANAEVLQARVDFAKARAAYDGALEPGSEP